MFEKNTFKVENIQIIISFKKVFELKLKIT